jgi:excisionase family DNA binding protein
MEQVFTSKEVAEHFKVHITTVKRWLQEGVFPSAFYVGHSVRIPLSDIEALKKNKRESA